MSNETISKRSEIKVHLNLFSSETLSELNFQKLEQTTLPLFIKFNISHVFSLSLGVFEPTTTWSRWQYVFIMLTTTVVLS